MPDFIVFFHISSSLITKECIWFIKTFCISTHFWKQYSQLFNFSSSLYSIKTISTKRNLARYYYFINIYIVYVDWVFVIMEVTFFKFQYHRNSLFIFILYAVFYVIMIYSFLSSQHFLLNI